MDSHVPDLGLFFFWLCFLLSILNAFFLVPDFYYPAPDCGHKTFVRSSGARNPDMCATCSVQFHSLMGQNRIISTIATMACLKYETSGDITTTHGWKGTKEFEPLGKIQIQIETAPRFLLCEFIPDLHLLCPDSDWLWSGRRIAVVRDVLIICEPNLDMPTDHGTLFFGLGPKDFSAQSGGNDPFHVFCQSPYGFFLYSSIAMRLRL